MGSVKLSAIAHHFDEMLKILNTLQWNLSITDTIGNQNFVRYREVTPAQGFPVYRIHGFISATRY